MCGVVPAGVLGCPHFLDGCAALSLVCIQLAISCNFNRRVGYVYRIALFFAAAAHTGHARRCSSWHCEHCGELGAGARLHLVGWACAC